MLSEVSRSSLETIERNCSSNGNINERDSSNVKYSSSFGRVDFAKIQLEQLEILSQAYGKVKSWK